jgi:hypothetical protein
MPNPLARDETRQPSGYIDIAFEITKFGESRAIDIVGASDNATNEAKQRLVRLVARSRFRPRVTHGEIRRSEPMVVRYYLSD